MPENPNDPKRQPKKDENTYEEREPERVRREDDEDEESIKPGKRDDEYIDIDLDDEVTGRQPRADD